MNENYSVDKELLKIKVDIWKTVIETQKHFNDLEMKVRNFGILILSAFIGATGVTFNSEYTINILGFQILVSAIFSLGAAIIWWLFYFVDMYWYHPLLLGAVRQGAKIEKELESILPEITLTKKIGESSPCDFLWFKKLHSQTKAKIFYFGILFILVLATIALLFVSPKNQKDNSIIMKYERSYLQDFVSCNINKLN
ncbi:hypothetical protein [Providencia alcalifaciens]|uniref:Uncharacterized protein n=1 Tax=Providencia alcalifaciens 205/92 TaxID=1256988 RepID=A0AAV3M0S0_9GAMM|nr:hypothetical protein [Providencia alcalifaciens]EUD09307.1 hypothetical protein HMPREF1563_3379 [Providencia alcalifaciens 205/92]MTC25874.1 hypothetical protein [Providencia alcalifaciens]MTC63049.1 hypothetical protein [Providencia alcalifaciens]WGZ54410.1 hypothetical protein PO864_00010 [Providencia alcalifaciens]